MRVIIGLAIVAIVALVGYYMWGNPDTVESQVSDAVQEGEQAVQDAAEATAEAAEAAGDAVDTAVQETEQAAASVGDELDSAISGLSDETRTEIDDMLAQWKDNGIVAADGSLDYDMATEAINASALSEENKVQAQAILTYLQNAPGDLQEKLGAIEAALQQ
jgi:hypothetical protein